MEVVRKKMIDEIVKIRKKYFDEELQKYRNAIEKLNDEKLKEIYISMFRKINK